MPKIDIETGIIIPARYGSTRFPGKPLANINGHPLIYHAYVGALDQGVCDAENICVATDDIRIKQVCEKYGINVIMTSKDCENGTERCAEVVEQLNIHDDSLIFNWQGDLISAPPDCLKTMQAAHVASPHVCSTPILAHEEAEDVALRRRVYAGVGPVTCPMDDMHRPLFFTRSYHPTAPGRTYSHIGIYAYTGSSLRAYKAYGATDLERVENLEQMRWLAMGFHIRGVPFPYAPHIALEVNVEMDIKKAEAYLNDTCIE